MYSLARVEHHHHTVCVHCGSVSEFRDVTVERLLRTLGEDIAGNHRRTPHGVLHSLPLLRRTLGRLAPPVHELISPARERPQMIHSLNNPTVGALEADRVAAAAPVVCMLGGGTR